MFYFGWVRTHLRVVFGDVFGLFWVLSWISEKRNKNHQNLEICGVLCLSVRTPCSGEGPLRGVGFPRSGVAEKRNGPGRSLRRSKRLRCSIAVLCRGVATVHSMVFLCFVMFCNSVIPRTCLLD